MSKVKVHQSAFHAGEISPQMLGRVDDPKQTQGLEACLNFICTPQGPVENRAGTEFVRVAKYPDKPTRVITFNRGSDQSMCLELGEKYIRFHTQRMTLLKDDGTPYEVVTPYTADEVFDICFMQSIDVVTLTHPNHPPMDLKRYGARDWRLEEVVLNNVLSAPTNVKVEYHCQDEDSTIKNKSAFTLSYVVTACDEKGERESVASSVGSVEGNLYISSAYAHISWNAVSGAKIYKVYKNIGGLYGFIGQTEETHIDDDNIDPDTSITVKYLDNAFKDSNTYPVSVTRFEQRRIFAGSVQYPHHIWMTRNGTEDDMSYRLPVRDDDRISVDMAVTDGGAIRHIVATTQLMILTEGGEYRVTPINSDAITPTSMNIRPQSFVGSSTVQPVLVNSNVIYVAARGGHVRELGYNYQAGGYVSGDICLRAAHLFDHYDIKDLAYQKSPYPLLWATSTTGDLLSACYIPEQAVLGWSKQRTQFGEFESVAVVPEGSYDYVYVVVNRLLNGAKYRIIECMRNRNFTSLEDAYLVDCGITVDKRGSSETITEVTGLSHLEGCSVAILGDGAVFPDQVVANGKIVLEHPVKIVHVGLPIEAKLTTLPVRIGVQDGTMGRGREKRVNAVWLRVLNSSGVWAGPKGGTLVENKNRTTEPAGSPPSLKSTEIKIVIPPSIDSEGQVEIQQTEPLPLSLLALTMDVDLST